MNPNPGNQQFYNQNPNLGGPGPHQPFNQNFQRGGDPFIFEAKLNMLIS